MRRMNGIITPGIARVAWCALALCNPSATSTWAEPAATSNAKAEPPGAGLELEVPRSAKVVPAAPTQDVARTSGSVVVASNAFSTARLSYSVTSGGGDLVLVCQNAVVAENETIGGDAVVVAGDLTIRGKVTGDAVCVGGKLVVGPSAQIGGDLVTVGSVAEIDPSAKISGSKVNVASFPLDLMKHLGPLAQAYGKSASAPGGASSRGGQRAVFFFALEVFFFGVLAFVALLMTAFMPARFARVTEHIEGDLGRSALLGLLLMFLLPLGVIILSLTLIITVFGLPLVPLVPLTAAFGLLAGYVALGRALGRRWFFSRGPLAQTLLGLAALQSAAILGDVVGLVAGYDAPVAVALGALGMLVCIAGSFMGLGAIVASGLGKRSMAETVCARNAGPTPPQVAPGSS
ncbi:MAG: polymer-forming cytoskeletal protein [Verrucomicrobiae bacterium]|nr:polymer-forming cytoskeletal protein [Verrucomicrobiae bacterium]